MPNASTTHAKNISCLCLVVVFLQGREEQGIHGQGHHMAPTRRYKNLFCFNFKNCYHDRIHHRSYTMETSFCGCDQGSLAGSHLNTIHLKNVGKDFCAAMAGLRDNDETMTMDDSGKLERESQSCCPLNCIRERRNYSKCIQERRAECHMVRN
ncbi:uncharacterized protein [Fopius arisanus]|uniref:Uncharacterized protein isoform X2 n=1 Tax=Fopius arisanus TaxID=64838 RepID=A0A9R1TMR1_9HYME|nr:PREDICTED: uncharacterized protein LOC105272117 isoform X2 [Fopius arisanus]